MTQFNRLGKQFAQCILTSEESSNLKGGGGKGRVGASIEISSGGFSMLSAYTPEKTKGGKPRGGGGSLPPELDSMSYSF